VLVRRLPAAASGGQYCVDEEHLLNDLLSRPPAA
jgi:hypothetical protein